MDYWQCFSRVLIMVYMVLSLVGIYRLVAGGTISIKNALGDASGVRGVVPSSEEEMVISVPPRENITFPTPDDEWFDSMIEEDALRSSHHQRKFLVRKDRVASQFEKDIRFQSKPGSFAAIVISDAFAFLHIWKCGGTTVAKFFENHQSSLIEPWIQSRKWVTLVRDPIDRFLSAWAECGFRAYKGDIDLDGLEKHSVLNWLDEEYDFRVRAFLREVKDFTFPVVWGSCHMHAHPQANFMMDESGHIDDHVAIVGDLSEMKAILKTAGLTNFTDDRKGRDASSNKIKSKYFPSNRELLRDNTIIELCEFLAVDYFLFDFEPPKICVQPGGPLARFQ